MKTREKWSIICAFGNFIEPEWTSIPYEDMTHEELSFLQYLQDNHYCSDYDGDIKDWHDREDSEDVRMNFRDKLKKFVIRGAYTSCHQLKYWICAKVIAVHTEEQFEPWVQRDEIKFLQMLCADVYTGSIVYHYRESTKVLNIFRGGNIIRTLYRLYSGKLPVSEAMFIPGGSTELKPFSELPSSLQHTLSNGHLMQFRIWCDDLSDIGLSNEEIIRMTKLI